MEVVTDLTFLDSKLHNEDHSSHEIKRHLLLGRKIMPELDKIWKTSDLGPSGKASPRSEGTQWDGKWSGASGALELGEYPGRTGM